MKNYERPPYMLGDVIGYIVIEKDQFPTIKINKIVDIVGYIADDNNNNAVDWFFRVQEGPMLELIETKDIIYKLN